MKMSSKCYNAQKNGVNARHNGRNANDDCDDYCRHRSSKKYSCRDCLSVRQMKDFEKCIMNNNNNGNNNNNNSNNNANNNNGKKLTSIIKNSEKQPIKGCLRKPLKWKETYDEDCEIKSSPCGARYRKNSTAIKRLQPKETSSKRKWKSEQYSYHDNTEEEEEEEQEEDVAPNKSGSKQSLFGCLSALAKGIKKRKIHPSPSHIQKPAYPSVTFKDCDRKRSHSVCDSARKLPSCQNLNEYVRIPNAYRRYIKNMENFENQNSKRKQNNERNERNERRNSSVEDEEEYTYSSDGQGSSCDERKRIQDTCLDFLNIVHDTVIETVQKSVEEILKNAMTTTYKQLEMLNNQVLRSECLLSKTYYDIMEKINQQNERHLQQYKMLAHLIMNHREFIKEDFIKDEFDQNTCKICCFAAKANSNTSTTATFASATEVSKLACGDNINNSLLKDKVITLCEHSDKAGKAARNMFFQS